MKTFIVLCCVAVLTGVLCQDLSCTGNKTEGTISGCDVTCFSYGKPPHACPLYLYDGCTSRADPEFIVRGVTDLVCTGNTTEGNIYGCDVVCPTRNKTLLSCPLYIYHGCACKPHYIAVKRSFHPQCVLPEDCP